MNRAQRRHNSQQIKAAQRRGRRRARQLPRCPLCQNEITERDRAKTDDGSTVHKSCAERLETAKTIAAAQRMEASGFWLPGQD